MKKLLSILLSLIILCGVLPIGAITANAATSYTEGYYTYTVSNGEATITDFDSSVVGAVDIPSTLGGYPVTSIGKGAFYNCSSLTSIAIPDGVTSIGNSAFLGCSSLTSITIPDGVTSIGGSAFSDCSSLTSITIPDSVTSISDSAFSGCSSLTKITIPDGVTSIGEIAFFNCSSLTKITIPDGVTSIGEMAFFNCSSLTKITIPDGVTSIGEYAFRGCSSLTSITIPDGVTSIGSSTFDGCSSLENVYITDISKWCSITFSNLYSNPMYYADNLYVNNQILTDLKIPEDTQIVDMYRFYNCKSIESVYIPKSIVLIKQDAFYNCSGIKNVYFEGTAEEWDAVTKLDGNDYLKNATVYYNSNGMPDKIDSVSVTKLPEKVTYIENEENLDLTGGVLTVNYTNGSTLDIDLATLNVTGFDNSALGKQTITVKYGEHSAQFEVEVVIRPISYIGVVQFPDKTVYAVGDEIDLTGGKIAVCYPEGNYAVFDITADMVSGYDKNKAGCQFLTVTYKGYTTKFTVMVFEKADPDLNGDGIVGAGDIVIIKTALLNSQNTDLTYDVNGDGVVNILDLIRLKKNIAGVQ